MGMLTTVGNTTFRYALGIWALSSFCAFSQNSSTPNLSGVWRRSPTESRPGARPPAEMWVKVEHAGSDITFTIRTRNNGADEVNVERLRIGTEQNRNEMHGAPMLSKSAWSGSTLVVDSVTKFGNAELRMNTRWTVSADRQTLESVQLHQFGAEPKPTEDTSTFARQPDNAWQAPEAPKNAEQAYPNIKILTGVPATRVPAIMGAFTRALGVGCTHCHVDGAMEKEDKPAFSKARQMFGMRNWIAENQKIQATCW